MARASYQRIDNIRLGAPKRVAKTPPSKSQKHIPADPCVFVSTRIKPIRPMLHLIGR